MIARLTRLISTWKDYAAAVGTAHALIVIQAIVQVILVPIYLAGLGKETFGILVFVGSFLTIVNICLNAMRGVLIRFMALSAGRENFHEMRVYFAATRLLLFVYFSIAALILVALSIIYERLHAGAIFDQINFGLVVFLSAAHLLVQAVFNAEYFLLTALRRQAWGNVYFILGIVFFVVPVLPWLYLGGNIEGVVALQLISSIAITVIAIGYRHHRLPHIPRRTDWYRLPPITSRYLGREGRVYLKYAFLSALLQGDILLVGLLGGPNAAADFTIIWRIAEVLVLLLWRFSDSLQPEILRLEAHGQFLTIRQVYLRGLPVIVGLSLAAGLTYAFAGPFIVALWVGKGAILAPAYVYWAAGAGLFWLAIARYSTVFPLTLARLEGLVQLTLTEFVCRIGLILILFWFLNYGANLVAITAVHLFGVGWAYMALARRATAPPSDTAPGTGATP